MSIVINFFTPKPTQFFNVHVVHTVLKDFTISLKYSTKCISMSFAFCYSCGNSSTALHFPLKFVTFVTPTSESSMTFQGILCQKVYQFKEDQVLDAFKTVAQIFKYQMCVVFLSVYTVQILLVDESDLPEELLCIVHLEVDTETIGHTQAIRDTVYIYCFQFFFRKSVMQHFHTSHIGAATKGVLA